MKEYLQLGIARSHAMVEDSGLLARVEASVDMITNSLRLGGPLLVCGNGGSASDALHITGELVGRFNLERRSLNVVCLNANVTVMTAWANDVGWDSVFARQVEAHHTPNAVLWGLSTSGNSLNVISAFRKARELDMSTIALTGEEGGKLAPFSDIILNVPAQRAPEVQELHLPVYHYVCARVEAELALR